MKRKELKNASNDKYYMFIGSLKAGSHMIAPIVSVASVASKSVFAPIATDFANDRSDRDDRGDHMRTSLKK